MYCTIYISQFLVTETTKNPGTSHQDVQHSRQQLEGRVQTVPMQNCNKAASMSWQVNQEQEHSVVPIAQSLAAACLTPASVNAKIGHHVRLAKPDPGG